MLASYAYEWLLENLEQTKGNYLEIGTWDGEGIRSLALKYPSKTFYAVDPFIEDGNTAHLSQVSKSNSLNEIKVKALNNIKDKKNIILFEETSTSFNNRVQDEELSSFNIEVVFVDGDHSQEAVVEDAQLAMKILGKKSGVILFDDLHLSGPQIGVQIFENEYKDRIVKKTVPPTHGSVLHIFEIKGIE